MSSQRFGEQLQAEFCGCSLGFKWLGTGKAIGKEFVAQAADNWGADHEYMSARKKLFDTKRPEIRALTAIKNRARELWIGSTLPFPRDGVRLLRRSRVDAMVAEYQAMSAELQTAVESLDAIGEQLRFEARERLGELFDPSDYPASYRDLFAIKLEFPSLEAPEFLRDIAPNVYESEAEAVRDRFQAAVTMAEDAFKAELATLVSHISERLAGNDDGKPKIFRDSMLDNLREFFDRFRNLSIGSSAELDELVNQAEAAIRGVSPEALRDSQANRDTVRESFARIEERLAGSMVDRPARVIRLPGSTPATAPVPSTPSASVETESTSPALAIA